jgi:hypothetical protein
MPGIIGQLWMGVSMLGLLLIGLFSGILAIAMASVEGFDLTVSPLEQPGISWQE